MSTTRLTFVFLTLVVFSAPTFAENRNVAEECVLAANDAFTSDLNIFGPFSFPFGQSRAARIQYLNDNFVDPTLLSWILNMSPDLEPRESALDLAAAAAMQLLQSQGFSSDLKALFTDEASHLHPYSAAALAQNQQIFAPIISAPDFPDMAQARSEIPQICSIYIFPECKKALNHVLDLMHVSVNGAYWLSVPDRLSAVLSDPLYRQALAKMSLSVIQSEESIARSSKRDIYHDLVATFESLGVTALDAQNRALTVLAVFGARGASLESMTDIMHSEAAPVMAGMFMVSAQLGQLDLLRYLNGLRPYSLPPSVNFNCNYGRPYHFWMGAYLGAQMNEDGFGAITSLLAVHIAGVGYEFAIPAYGKTQDRIYTDVFFNPYNVNTQINIAQDDAGADYGTRLKVPGLFGISWPKTDINQAIESMFLAARPMPQLSPDELTKELANDTARYKLFWRVISPDADLPVMGLGLFAPKY
jgi:hypothetical protein